MTGRLPQLLDKAQLAAELGQPETIAETLMQKVGKVRIGRRVFVKRADVERYLSDQEVDARGFAA